MINALLRVLLRCSHRQITRPITPKTHAGTAHCGTYVVCLDCGAHFPYDWENMRVGRQIPTASQGDVLLPRTGETS